MVAVLLVLKIVERDALDSAMENVITIVEEHVALSALGCVMDVLMHVAETAAIIVKVTVKHLVEMGVQDTVEALVI